MAEEPAGKAPRRALRIGKYEVLGHIASGGMGAVYKARDVDLNRTVALKILSPEMAARPNMLERFRREARWAAKLRHENIVAIYEIDEYNGTHYIALEYVDGKDLYDHISRQGRLDPEEARQIVIQAARALDHAHRANIVHRDIKPSNFLLTQHEGRLLVKLTDLGLAQELSDDLQDQEARLTREHHTVGTVDYMAPEQAKDSKAADVRSDIYALGCTFFHMLAGKCPFPTGSLTERILQHLQAEPPNVRDLNPKVPPGLVAVVRKMMAKKPQDRYQTPAELLKDLEAPERLHAADKSDRMASLAELAAAEGTPRKRPAPAPIPPRPDDSDLDESDIEPADEPEPQEEEVVVPGDKGRKKRFRDPGPEESGEVPEGKGEGKGFVADLPPWWPYAAALVVAILAVLVWSQVGSRKPPPPKDVVEVKPPDPPPKFRPIEIPPEKVEDPPPKPKDDDKKPEDKKPEDKKPPPAFVGPPPPALPLLFPAAAQLDRAALEREIVGPFTKSLPIPEGAKVVKVRRIPGADGFASIEEALAATEGPTVIEVHDQGPLFVPSLPALKNRDLVIRAGKGFRPLVAWDPGKAVGSVEAGAGSLPWLTLHGGSLTLEGLDLGLHRVEGAAEAPAFCFLIRGGSFQARGCTFSLAGRYPAGVVLARLEGPANLQPRPDDPDFDPALHLGGAAFRLTNCYARGRDLAVLSAGGPGVEALIEDSLLAADEPPLIQLEGGDEDAHTLRLVRSTLVAGQNLLRGRTAPGKTGAPRLRVLAWDALLARGNGATLQGDLVHLTDGLGVGRLSWRGVNCLYAGWKRLLAADRIIPAGSLEAWREQWKAKEGERELPETWPPYWPGEPEGLPAGVYYPFETAACFAATSGPGPLGCDVGRLPLEPPLWLPRTYERYPLPPLPLPEAPAAPTIPNPGDGLYHGEFVDASKADLGQLLESRLMTAKPGPRVVLHVIGKGKQVTSPIVPKGIRHLVLYFEKPAGGKDEPLSLGPNPRTLLDRALIQAEDCSVELINARFHLENRRLAPATPHLIKLRGGDLTLSRCTLVGPFDKAPDVYQGLIRLDAPPGGERPGPLVTWRDSVLISGKHLLDLRGSPARVRARNCVLLAAEDGLLLAPAAEPRPGLFLILENNTLAFRKRLLQVTTPEGAAPREPVTVHANANYFVAPFADEPKASQVLHLPPPALAAGWLLWQGRANAFDHQRLGAYAGGLDPERGSLKAWQRLWGTPGETSPVAADPVKSAKAFTPDAPNWSLLALPPSIRVLSGQPPYGADLVQLGLVKKK